MQNEPLSVEWLSHWRSQVEAALETLTSTFEQKYGYPPGTNEIRPPDAEDQAAASELAGEHLAPRDLLTFHQHVGAVTLADVGNAYFIHSAKHTLAHFHAYKPVWFSDAKDRQGMVIASDGGGILFAVDAGGTVYRSSAASTESDFTKVADSLREFLDLIYRSIVRFIETDQPGYL